MRKPSEWSDLSLRGDPILVVGRRPKPRALEASVIDLDRDTFGTTRAIARETIHDLAERSVEEWHPNAHIEAGEQYLSVGVSGLPPPPPPRHPPPGGSSDDDGESGDDESASSPYSPTADAAALLRLVLHPGDLENLEPGELPDGDFRFYALVWERGDDGDPVAFVSEYDPTYVLRRASSWFRFDGTLRSADAPDFALDDRADLVITEEEIAVLSTVAFDRLFSDIRALLNEVPKNVAALRRALQNLPMSDESAQAIEEVCAKKASLARRLQDFAASPAAAVLTPATLRGVLRRHGQDPTLFISRGTLRISPGEVGAFLDVAEGRWYEADFTNEPRRAARWSRR
jgi:hypothetical protein